MCPPIDLKASSENIENKLWGVYSRALADYMKESWKLHKEKFMHFKLVHDIDMEKILKKCKTLWDIDHHFTSKIHGFKDGHHYYQEAGSINLLQNIKVPTLYMYSDDDEMIGINGMPKKEVFENHNFISLLQTGGGGHLAYIESSLSCGQWFTKPLIAYFDKL